MGVYHCEHCFETLCGETFGCKVCGFAQVDGNAFCDGCDASSPCGRCETFCCRLCESKFHECCGLVICGSGNVENFKSKEEMRKEDGVEHDACIWDHVKKKLDCGHIGCNYNKEYTCRTCSVKKAKKNETAAIQKDRLWVEDLLKKSGPKSRALSAYLQEFLKDPEQKDRVKVKRELEEFQKKANYCKCQAYW
ncbi:expressed unknown protein [Seminavis robusta]|uniref:Uncharacterized protein n=1 Tax=Seminavis robusta TaxID=568900 RepID=A0A9N8ETS3_9STRA|nr:expressed unknown protein [Seminavis robusta]|eukprot:Sro1928_g306020.1 n/a (193) ;mRNA; f:9137-9715